jgi:SAM-dependent methyltransferase
MQARHERQRVLAALLARHLRQPPARLSLLEVGCGHGDNLLELIGLGFDPARLLANELLPERAAAARARLPPAVRVLEGDALALPLPEASLDVVLQSTVFSSLLDAGFRARLAARLWAWLKPGGAVVWYDFAIGNPRNADVTGMPLAEVRRLFPAATIDARRVTLAPPLARRAAALHPGLPALLNTLPLLRTHRLAWIAKPDV